jgi:hypothetical protein
VPFDWRQVQLRLENADWKLLAGSVVLANFGGDEQDARLALSAVRHYRFAEQWRVGGDAAPFTYFLANGQAPRGVPLGLPAQSFQPEQLAVQQVGPRYALTAGTQVLARFGDRPDEARQLVRRGGGGRMGARFCVPCWERGRQPRPGTGETIKRPTG